MRFQDGSPQWWLICQCLSLVVTEFEVFKLLVELSYGVTYTRRGDGPVFPHDTLIALITVANMFDFIHCTEECCDEIGQGLTADNALGIIASLAQLDPLRDPIKQLLDKAIGRIGPLESLWEQGPFCDDISSAISKTSFPAKLEVGRIHIILPKATFICNLIIITITVLVPPLSSK